MFSSIACAYVKYKNRKSKTNDVRMNMQNYKQLQTTYLCFALQHHEHSIRPFYWDPSPQQSQYSEGVDTGKGPRVGFGGGVRGLGQRPGAFKMQCTCMYLLQLHKHFSV